LPVGASCCKESPSRQSSAVREYSSTTDWMRVAAASACACQLACLCSVPLCAVSPCARSAACCCHCWVAVPLLVALLLSYCCWTAAHHPWPHACCCSTAPVRCSHLWLLDKTLHLTVLVNHNNTCNQHSTAQHISYNVITRKQPVLCCARQAITLSTSTDRTLPQQRHCCVQT
jgi:hypothetical protein